jgi:hypothetical protein
MAFGGELTREGLDDLPKAVDEFGRIDSTTSNGFGTRSALIARC